jgi:hypothetical protein
MGYSKHIAITTLITLLLMFAFGEYLVRWLLVLLFATVITILLFVVELTFPAPRPRNGESPIRERREVSALAKLIKKAKNSKTARSLIEERIIEIYSEISEDYKKTYSQLHSDPNDAIKTLRREGDFIDNLEEALKIVEADLNEN